MISGCVVGRNCVPTNNWSAWRWRYPSAILHWWAARSVTCNSPCPPKLGVVKRTGIQPCANDGLGSTRSPTPMAKQAATRCIRCGREGCRITGPPLVALRPLLRRQYRGEPSLDRLVRDRAGIDQSHDALGVDKHGRRHSTQRVVFANLPLLIEQHGKRHVELGCELPAVPHPLLISQVDRQYLEVLFLVIGICGKDVGHLSAARFAPGGPEIEKDGTTRVIGQPHRATGERLQRASRRGRSERLCGERRSDGEKRRGGDRSHLRTEPHLAPPT